jgi:hypothetical protein
MLLRLPSLSLALLFCAASPAPGTAAPASEAREAAAPGLADAWRKVALNLFTDAHRDFLALPGEEARLGAALTRLQLQPKTAANVDAAAAALRELAAAGDPVLAPVALHTLARIEHVHRLRPDLSAAVARYEELRRLYPDHPLADEAVVRLAIIAFQDPSPPERAAAELARFAALASDLRSADARRDLHLLLADTALRLRHDEAFALEHYLAAEAAGIHLAAIRTTVLVSIGELAARLGRPEVARRHLEDYLVFAPRDNRRTLVLERLASLPGAGGEIAPVAAPALAAARTESATP